MNLVNEGVLPPDELDDRDERREEQERARSRETVADIVADLRKCAQRWKKLCEGIKDGNLREALKPQTEIYSILADRLEAAWKRELDHAIEHATRHAEAVARDNCRDCVHNPSGKNYEGGNGGNAAAVREALVAIRDAARMFCHQILNSKYNDMMDEYKCRERGFPALLDLRAAIPKANFALSAPPRNCDLYDTQPTMSMAYEAYRKAAMRSYGNGLTGAVPTVKQKPMTYDEWLLAPAAERKGE